MVVEMEERGFWDRPWAIVSWTVYCTRGCRVDDWKRFGARSRNYLRRSPCRWETTSWNTSCRQLPADFVTVSTFALMTPSTSWSVEVHFESFCILKPRPHQQQCQSNIVKCYKVECCFDNVERCFDIVAGVYRALDAFLDAGEQLVTENSIQLSLMNSLMILRPKSRVSRALESSS